MDAICLSAEGQPPENHIPECIVIPSYPPASVITIEDSAELQITQVPNLVRLETRNANTEEKGKLP